MVRISVDSPDRLAARLRAHEPPVIARIEDDVLCLDPRTVLPEQDEILLSAILASVEQA
jgi:L-seryl-tRNA(Ser) seleniumtransferase